MKRKRKARRKRRTITRARPNPPQRTVRKRRKRSAGGGGKVSVFRFGKPESLIYTRAGKRFQHKFGPGAVLLVPKSGANWLAIKGVKVAGYIEG